MPAPKSKTPGGLWGAIEKLFVGKSNIYDPDYDPVAKIKEELTKLGIPPHIHKKFFENMPGAPSDKALEDVSSPKVVAKSPKKASGLVGR
jgi:hypothetical protein